MCVCDSVITNLMLSLTSVKTCVLFATHIYTENREYLTLFYLSYLAI